ncbi:MAG: hypothetical protein CMJ29_01240 [Phycisphaerae bacterium]|nr:hypothetical protein [Phycisphaerae bacterium]
MIRWCLLILICLTCCSKPQESSVPHEGPRIVSLSPAMTSALEDAGLGPYLVGRSNWCRPMTRSLDEIPAVGDLHERDWEALIRISPTHVFFQSEDVSSDQAMVELAAQQNWALQAWPLRTIGDIKKMLDDLPSTIQFENQEKNQNLLLRCDQLGASLIQSISPTPIASGQRVLIVNDGVPPLAWGTTTYLGEMLEATDAENVAGEGGWKTLSMEDVVRLRPDLIIVVSDQVTDDEPAILQEPLASISSEQCQWLIHPRINFPGPHLVEACADLKSILSANGASGTNR